MGSTDLPNGDEAIQAYPAVPANVSRRPVVIVSRDAITASSPNVIVLPMFSLENFQKIYPSQTVLRSNDSGLIGDGVVMAEQIRTISETRL